MLPPPGLRERRRKPFHPGAVLREQVLPALRITPRQLAERLGVSPGTVTALLGERRDLSMRLAARIGKLLGEPARRWLALQMELDLWRIARHADALSAIEPMSPSVQES